MSIPYTTNLQLVIPSDDSNLFTLRDDGGTDKISEIDSQESTGNSLVQATEANQPVYENSLIKTLAANAFSMTVDSAPDIRDGNFVVSMRVSIQDIESGVVGNNLFGNRDDNASHAIRWASEAIGIQMIAGGTILDTVIPTEDEFIVFTLAVDNTTDPDNRVGRCILGDQTLVEQGVSRGSAGATIRFFGHSSSNGLPASFSHVFFASAYPSQSEFEAIHAWMQNEMASDSTTGMNSLVGMKKRM